MDEADRFTATMHRSADLVRAAAGIAGQVIVMAGACESNLWAGGAPLFCGDRDAAADGQHLATELMVRLRASVTRPSSPALSLKMASEVLTAVGDDFGFDEVLARPLRGLGRPGDVPIMLSTSRRSANVLRALEAGDQGIDRTGLLSGDGGPAAALCEPALVAPRGETARVQECGMALGHPLVELLGERIMAAPL